MAQRNIFAGFFVFEYFIQLQFESQRNFHTVSFMNYERFDHNIPKLTTNNLE